MSIKSVFIFWRRHRPWFRRHQERI